MTIAACKAYCFQVDNHQLLWLAKHPCCLQSMEIVLFRPVLFRARFSGCGLSLEFFLLRKCYHGDKLTNTHGARAQCIWLHIWRGLFLILGVCYSPYQSSISWDNNCSVEESVQERAVSHMTHASKS
jgi:hypothetical protein